MREKCSRYATESDSPGSLNRNGFGGADSVHFYATNNNVKARNAQCMAALHQLLAYIKAVNSSSKAQSSSEQLTQGLQPYLYLCLFARVILT